jgi:hypothetical protein
MITNNCNFEDIFAYCCSNNLIEMSKCIYKHGNVNVNKIFNKKNNKIKKYECINNTIIKYLTNLSEQELKYDKFIDLCVLGNLENIKYYYSINNIFLEYKMHSAYINL